MESISIILLSIVITSPCKCFVLFTILIILLNERKVNAFLAFFTFCTKLFSYKLLFCAECTIILLPAKPLCRLNVFVNILFEYCKISINKVDNQLPSFQEQNVCSTIYNSRKNKYLFIVCSHFSDSNKRFRKTFVLLLR